MKAVTRYSSPDDVAAAVEQLQQGAAFPAGSVTLRNGQTTTTVKVRWCSARSQVFLFPLSATAATAVGAGVIYCTPGSKEFVVNHNNTADLDRTFSYLVLNTDTN